MNREWLGILVNDRSLEKITKGRSSQENLAFYEQAGQKYKLSPCYFSLRNISFKKNRVTVFIRKGKKWTRKMIPLPKVIHNRAIFQSKRNWARSERLVNSGAVLFNFWNRYGKWQIHERLSEEATFVPHLPVTLSFGEEALKDMMGRFTSLFIKPDKGTVGQGIVKLDKTEQGKWKAFYREGTKLATTEIAEEKLYEKLKKSLRTHSYIIQQTIPLATYQEAPFDLRVSVQKDATGEWGVTGKVGKAARRGHFLSNVAQGGKVFSMDHLLAEYPRLSTSKISRKIDELALAMVRHLDGHLPHLADVGFDFGIDTRGHPYFIEMNGRDQRYSFRQGGQHETWQATYEKPIAYARYLLEQKKVTER